MIRLTDIQGNGTILCDHCRCDIPQGSHILSMNPGKVDDGFIARDYSKGEIVICPDCAGTLSTMLSLTGPRRALALVIHQEAA